MRRSLFHSLAALLLGVLAMPLALAAQPATVRLDYTHSSNALQDSYAIERVVIEPLP